MDPLPCAPEHLQGTSREHEGIAEQFEIPSLRNKPLLIRLIFKALHPFVWQAWEPPLRVTARFKVNAFKVLRALLAHGQCPVNIVC